MRPAAAKLPVQRVDQKMEAHCARSGVVCNQICTQRLVLRRHRAVGDGWDPLAPGVQSELAGGTELAQGSVERRNLTSPRACETQDFFPVYQ